MELILVVMYIGLLLVLIGKWQFFKSKWISTKLIRVLFILKFTVGLFVFWIYNSYYSNSQYNRQDADVFKYFDDSAVLHNSLSKNPIDFTKIILGLDFDKDYFNDNYYINMNHWDSHYNSHIFNDARLIIRINAIIRIFSFGYYTIHILFFCFFSFVGLFALFKGTVDYVKKNEKLFFLCISLTPSILFWSSGVLKEPLMIYAVGFIFFHLHEIKKKKYLPFSLIHLLFCSAILFFLKFYVFCILILLILPFIYNHISAFRFKIVPYLASILLFTIMSFVLKKVNPKFDILTLIEQKQESFISESKYKNAGSYFEINKLDATHLSVAKAIPFGIVNAFTRPFLWDIKKNIQIPSAVENIIFICLIIYSFFNVFKSPSILKKNTNFLIFCFLFVLINYALIGIITPVSGALVRYKIIALPFLIAILLKTSAFKTFKILK